MAPGPGWFRDLYMDLMWAETRETHPVLLNDRAGEAAEALGQLARLQTRPPQRPLTNRIRTDKEQLSAEYEMYALSRTSDYLLELGCPAGTAPEPLGETGGRCLDERWLAVHATFCDAIGLERIDYQPGFSGFHHEIFAVTTDDHLNHVVVEQVLWPGYRWGDLLFCRAGVHARAPRRLIDPVVATTSTLYFTNRRQPRRADDPSHGWGSNSQWATPFALFYDDADGLHFNWNADIDIAVDHPQPLPGWFDPNDDRPLERRRELLTNRSFIRAPLPDDEHDWYPYSDTLTIPGPAD